MALEKSDAIVLRLYEFSETSWVVHLLTRELGRVHALAKGARRARPRGGEHLDLLARAEVVLLRKPTAALATLTEYAVRDNFPAIRSSLPRLHAAYFLGELVHEVSRENERNEALYAAAVDGLAGLERAPREAIEATLLGFEARFLAAAGYWPEVRRCVHCRREPAADERIGFSAKRGGILCSRCLGEDPAYQRADRGSLVVLASLAAIRGDALDRVRLPARTFAEVRRVLDPYYEYVFERPLRTARFLDVDA
jgi:DNA repair protein RecO (recombination protein O)